MKRRARYDLKPQKRERTCDARERERKKNVQEAKKYEIYCNQPVKLIISQAIVALFRRSLASQPVVFHMVQWNFAFFHHCHTASIQSEQFGNQLKCDWVINLLQNTRAD